MPSFWRLQALLAKIETVYGTDPTPTGAANAILAEDVRVMPMEGQDVTRGFERPYMIVVGATEARLDHFSSSTFDIASGAVPNNVVVLLDVPATCVSTATVPAIVEFEARFRNDVEAKTRLAFRLTALTGPSDHPETGDWTNLGVEYVYLHPASQQLIDYKKCIWFLNDFDLTTATKLRLRVEYFTSGGVWTGTDTAMENRIFSLRQSKRV